MSDDQDRNPSKRGLVISSPIEIDGTRLTIKSSQLDMQELRFSLLFWDRLVWPNSNLISIANGPEANFLMNAGILARPMVNIPFSGDFAEGVAKAHLKAFLDQDAAEPGAWALAQGKDSFLLKGQILQEGHGVFVELHRAIPIPDKDVPLDDLLEFRLRRHDEIRLLRDQLDNLFASLGGSLDPDGDLERCLVNIDTACADALKVGKEWRFPVRLSNVKLSIDFHAYQSIAAAVIGWQAGKSFDLPLTSAVITGISASLKLGADFGLQKIRRRQGPYRYVSQFHQEVF